MNINPFSLRKPTAAVAAFVAMLFACSLVNGAEEIRGIAVAAEVMTGSTQLIGFKPFRAQPEVFYRTVTYSGDNAEAHIEGGITIGPDLSSFVRLPDSFEYTGHNGWGNDNFSGVTCENPIQGVYSSPGAVISNTAKVAHWSHWGEYSEITGAVYPVVKTYPSGNTRLIIVLPLGYGPTGNDWVGPLDNYMINVQSPTSAYGYTGYPEEWNFGAELSDPDTIETALARIPWSMSGQQDPTGLSFNNVYSFVLQIGGDERTVSAVKARVRVAAATGCGEGAFLARLTLLKQVNGLPDETVTISAPVTIVDPASGSNFIDLPFEAGTIFRLREVWLEPLSCGSCNEKSLLPGFGPGAKRGSVDLKILVSAAADGTAAYLSAYSSDVADSLYSPVSLELLAGSGSGAVAVRAGSTLRQVRSPDGLVDVIETATQAYEVRFYREADIGAANENGIYAVSGNPYVVWTVANPDPEPGSQKRLRVTRTVDSTQVVAMYSHDVTTGSVSLSEGNGLRTIEELPLTAAAGERRALVTTKSADGTIVAQVEERYLQRNGRWILVSEINDPNGRALMREFDAAVSNASQTLYTDQAGGSYKTETINTVNGALTQSRDYVATGVYRTTAYVYSAPTDIDGDGVAEKLQKAGATLTGSSSAVERPAVPVRYTLQLSGHMVEGSDTLHEIRSIVGATSAAVWNDPANLVTTERYLDGGRFAGRLAYRLLPDGVITRAHYSENATSGEIMETTEVGAPSADLQTVVSGERTSAVRNRRGEILYMETSDIASGLVTATQVAVSIDADGRATGIAYSDGAIETRIFSPCCGRLESSSLRGITTTYEYDDLGRLTKELTTNSAGEVLSGRRSEFDAASRTLKTFAVGQGNVEKLQDETIYDVAGYVVARKDALGRTTTVAETFPTYAQLGAGGAAGTAYRTTTVTSPDLGTAVSKTFNGGFLAEVSGTAQPGRTYSFGSSSGVSAPFGVTTTWRRESLVGTSETITTHTNALGQIVGTQYADSAKTQYFYNAGGQLVRQVDPDGVATLFAYDTEGKRSVTAVDMDRNSTIDYTGSDRIVQIVNEVANAHGTVVRRSRTFAWDQVGNATPRELDVTEASVDGLRSWRIADGLTTYADTVYDPSGLRTGTTTLPDTSTQVTVSRGRTQSTMRQAGGTTLAAQSFAYDPFGRTQLVTDFRSGTTSFSYYDDDQVATVTTPDPDAARSGAGYDPQTTTYYYDGSGRLNKVVAPDNATGETSYYLTGLVKRTWGGRAYPVEYTYDTQNRLKTLKTWQNFAGDAGAATTTWNYQANNGRLLTKVYNDTKATTYTYWPSGRLKTRKWARKVGTADLLTTYGFDNGGSLTGIDYSDTTPDAVHTYDRLGRVATTTDAAGLLTRSYSASGDLDDEVYSGTGTLSGQSITRTFDSLGRLNALAMTSPLATLGSVSYGYDAASRLQTVTNGTNSVTYGYVPNSSLVGSVSFQNNGAVRVTTTKTYDSLNRLVSIASTPGAAPVLSHAYDYNAANQRAKATREDGRYWDYGYDSLGQVNRAQDRLADTTIVAGRDLAFTYDDIGNRKTTTSNGHFASYTSNLLNQYPQRDVPGFVDVTGSALPGASVTVVQQPAARQGTSFYRGLAVTNTSTAVKSSIEVVGVLNNAGASGEDAIATDIRTAFVAKTPEVFTYDADGNSTGDGRWIYTWDGENRLASQETSTAAVTAGMSRQKLEFAYDAAGRRISKKLSNWNGSAWTLVSQLVFLYDGWNMVAETNALSSNAAVRSYTWGLDLSGSGQGAGGVGGLLIASVAGGANAGAYFADFDGNGNVRAYLRTSAGTVATRREYGPFGELLRGVEMITDLPFSFSTKYTDSESGYCYYGHRYYQPTAGRWLSRDPIEEQGGTNLYGFVGNDPVGAIDLLGLECWSPEKCAQLKQDIIDAYAAKGAYDGTAPSGYTVGRTVSDPASGFTAREFTSADGGDRIVAFAGTDPSEMGDLAADTQQLIGHPIGTQYDFAANISQVLGRPSRFVGHSLGGGEAHLAGGVAHVPVVTFNAAALHPNTISFYGNPERWITPRNIVLQNDFLTILQRNLSRELGINFQSGINEVYPNPRSKRFYEPQAAFKVQMHLIGNVIKSLEKAWDAHCK